MKRKRILHVFAVIVIICLAGTLYSIINHNTGIGVPCIFRTITGWQCPGCGVTHMCNALLRLDFKAAYMANPAVFLLLPVFGILLLKHTMQYIRDGRYRIGRAENVLLAGCIVILLVFGVARNIV